MHYIVLDLEWNQCPYGKDRENPKLPFEILEIGAVRLNDSFEIEGTFSETVRPVVYRQLHYRTKEVIGERVEEFRKSRVFPDVARDFLKFCGEDFLFCTWGPSDLPELQRNLLYYGLDGHFPRPLFFYDVQKLFSLCFEDGKLRRSLEFAVEWLQIPKDSPFHHAFDDTYYTSLVMKRLDWEKVHEYLSVDYYRPPTCREEEIQLRFADYTKFVSRLFPNRDEVLSDRVVTQTRCMVCGRILRKTISWFPTSQRQYVCVMECPVHGLQKGKLRIKKGPDSQVFAIRTIKIATKEQIRQLSERNAAYKKRMAGALSPLRQKAEREKGKVHHASGHASES